jgi:hypothetical protein
MRPRKDANSILKMFDSYYGLRTVTYYNLHDLYYKNQLVSLGLYLQENQGQHHPIIKKFMTFYFNEKK